MNVLDIIKVAGIVLVSLFGGSGIVALVVKYAAGWLSQRLLDHYNNEHEKELEGIKARYTEALAKTQLELDKAERRHYLYSQSQFELYNSLWKQLVYTKRIADDLWRVADPQKLPSFADQIRQTKFVIEENMLLIEDEHYAALMKLMTEFENFSVGKRKLVEIRQSSAAEVLDNIEDIRRMIHENGGSKQRYDSLVETVGASFRNQIHGQYSTMNENDEDATTYEKKVLVFIKIALLSDNLSTFIKEVELASQGIGKVSSEPVKRLVEYVKAHNEAQIRSLYGAIERVETIVEQENNRLTEAEVMVRGILSYLGLLRD